MGRMDADIEQLPDAPDGYKYMPCRHCDKPMLVGNRRRKLPSHAECGIGLAVENARQIAAKEGPLYDKWLDSQRKYLVRITGGGLPPNAGE